MSGVSLRSGFTVYDMDGAALSLDKEIGKGGEGAVWSIQGNQRIAAKFYHKGVSAEHAKKLEVMCRLKSDGLLKVAAWPISTLKTKRTGQAEGLLMPRIGGYQAAHLLYSPKSRRNCFPEAQFPFIVHSAANVARAFATVHDAGQVIGDVNHGNLLVSNEALVALIDCDSFEISDHRIVYPCLVGVPTYTPPELQGKNFQGLRRTAQHDAFGLAVLIFHLLFLGRHPFAGIYKGGSADMTIEQAISEFRFAYSPDTTTQMQPPPSAPRLGDFPPEIGQLFVRAFSWAGVNGDRPRALEWITALEALGTSLQQCPANRTHHFPAHQKACPWCRVEGMVGIPMFGIKITFIGTDQFNISAVWAQIEAIRPVQESPALPTSQLYIGRFVVDARIADVSRKRRSKRFLSLAAIGLAIAIAFAVQPPALVSIAILMSGLFGMVTFWRAGRAQANEFIDARKTAQKDYGRWVQEWNQVLSAPSAFQETLERLNAARVMFNDLPTIRARRLAELNGRLREKQFQHFLESHRIDDAALPNIGKGRKELLRVFNVEDAFDVVPSKIGNIKGLGPTMQRTLMNWRTTVESKFHFDPNQGIDPRDLRALEQELNLYRAESVRTLTGGSLKLQQVLIPWKAHQASVLTQVDDAAKRLAQAEVNTRALRWL